jgi:hypothetical protein
MPPELVLEAAAQKVIAERFHQLFQADVVPTLARPFGISGESHSSHGDTETQRKTRKIKRKAFLPNLLCVSVALWQSLCPNVVRLAFGSAPILRQKEKNFLK